MDGALARMVDWRGAYRVLVGRLEGRRSFERREDNIKMNLQKIGYGYGMDRSGSGQGQGQVVGSCEHGNKPSSSIKCGEFHD